MIFMGGRNLPCRAVVLDFAAVEGQRTGPFLDTSLRIGGIESKGHQDEGHFETGVGRVEDAEAMGATAKSGARSGPDPAGFLARTSHHKIVATGFFQVLDVVLVPGNVNLNCIPIQQRQQQVTPALRSPVPSCRVQGVVRIDNLPGSPARSQFFLQPFELFWFLGQILGVSRANNCIGPARSL